MAYEQRPNSGSLFVNKRKEKPNQPDYNGDVLIDVNALTVENGMAKIRIAGWKKSTRDGGSFLSLAFSQPEPKQQQPQSKSLLDLDSDPPF